LYYVRFCALRHLPSFPTRRSSDLGEAMLKIIQSFDPAGIGARDLRECLVLQLQDFDMDDTLAYRIVREYFDQLINHRWSEISKRSEEHTSELQSRENLVCRLLLEK